MANSQVGLILMDKMDTNAFIGLLCIHIQKIGATFVWLWTLLGKMFVGLICMHIQKIEHIPEVF